MDGIAANQILVSELETLDNSAATAAASTNLLTMALTALRINFPSKITSVSTSIPLSRNNEIVKVTSEKFMKLPEITLNEVAEHDHLGECWIVLYDRVYDVTKFLKSHPGGQGIILEDAGRDATLQFRGAGHSEGAIEMLREFLIGELPVSQRIFNGIFKRPDIPK